MLPRNLSRAVVRRVPRARGARQYATESDHVLAGNPTKEWVAQREAVEHHAAETTDLWRKLSFYVAIPTTLLVTVWVRNVEEKHAEHEAHLKEENGGHLPQPPDYPYMNKRIKPFPWGMNVLFFNSETNKNMEGEAAE
ncbi:mitochondrial cytochrome c oxidase subunit VIa [Rickenella mellea]|uniref:Mitochondrial cytochrome c oxidase subunit VIa n=1 Tax=Rickenella mellea TaxID=50990 RepID=A0A4Y7QN59_9AGAM|nr:mitochondrial cytochrome c oxidase subunit VIa [Rickenella mellea]